MVATPKRLAHLVKAKQIDLSSVQFLILDEADKLFESGFVSHIDAIIHACSNPSIVSFIIPAHSSVAPSCFCKWSGHMCINTITCNVACIKGGPDAHFVSISKAADQCALLLLEVFRCYGTICDMAESGEAELCASISSLKNCSIIYLCSHGHVLRHLLRLRTCSFCTHC